MSNNTERDVELPDEILFKILSWLPAKSVCISKCCSKSFLHFTKSPNFALKQSRNSLLKDDSYFFIQNCFSRLANTEIHSSLPSSSSATDQIPRDKVGVPSKFLRYLHQNSARILASTNGLLLCQTSLTNGESQLFICNPTTLSHSSIPSPITHGSKRYSNLFSFDCNYNDEDYKLYALQCDYVQSPYSVVCKMYIPKEGVWKEREARFILGKTYFISFMHMPVFYNGAIHFLIIEHSRSRYCKYLASYNVESGVSRMIELPDGAEDEDKEEGIFKWGEVGSKKESLCLVKLKGNRKVGYAFTVWVLSDHESSSGGNWSKILCGISLKEMGLDRMCYQVLGFTVMNGRSLVFATETEVYDYDLSSKRETRLEKVCDHELIMSGVSLFPYSDTLRSCGISSTTLDI